MKQMMVCSAGWRVRNKVNAETLEVNLMTEELDNAVNDRRNRSNPESSSNGNWYLRAVDASKKAVPHMNLAAKRAKQNAEAIQHWFGMGSIFLTVTPDDENSLIVQIYSGIQIDSGDQPVVNQLTKILPTE